MTQIMTVGEKRKERWLNSPDCHLINGIYYYKWNKGIAYVLKATPGYRNVVIPETVCLPNGEELVVVRIDYIAFANTDIESIVIPKTIKRIERNAFAH